MKILLYMLLFFGCNLTAQEESAKTFNTKKWVHTIGMGASRYIYKGVTPGRNEINFKSVGGKVNQSKGRGVILDMKIQRRYKKNYFGAVFNWYADALNAGYEQTINQIKLDSMKYLTIYDNQAYFNWGLSYEREIYKTFKDRLSVNASISFGYSNNRTPDRLEYDYFKNDFLLNSSGRKIMKTKFKDGYFFNPSINAKINIAKNHGIMVEFSGIFQFHSTREQYESGFSKFSNGKQRTYSVKGLQIRTSYFF